MYDSIVSRTAVDLGAPLRPILEQMEKMGVMVSKTGVMIKAVFKPASCILS